MRRAKAVRSQDFLISLNFAERVVKKVGLNPTSGRVEILHPQIFKQEQQDSTILELDLKVNEVEACLIGASVTFQPNDRPEIRIVAAQHVIERGPQFEVSRCYAHISF